jgi:hypothetical protein
MPKKASPTQNRKINIMLSSGLYVISVKCRKDTPLYTLFITDFVENTRIIFDAETMKVLPNKLGVELNKKDVADVVKALGIEKKELEVVVAGEKIQKAKEALKAVEVKVSVPQHGSYHHYDNDYYDYGPDDDKF